MHVKSISLDQSVLSGDLGSLSLAHFRYFNLLLCLLDANLGSLDLLFDSGGLLNLLVSSNEFDSLLLSLQLS